MADPVFFAWGTSLQQIWQVQGHYACAPSSNDNYLGILASCMIGQYQVWSSILLLAGLFMVWCQLIYTGLGLGSVDSTQFLGWQETSLLRNSGDFLPYLHKIHIQICLVLCVGEKSALPMDCLATCYIPHWCTLIATSSQPVRSFDWATFIDVKHFVKWAEIWQLVEVT